MKVREFDELPVEVKKARLSGKALQLELSRYHADGLAAKRATPAVLDFRQASDYLQHTTGRWMDIDPVPLTADGFRISKQQIYRRQKRARENYLKRMNMSEAENNIRFRKPIHEWDNQELARGRPRNKDGKFRGAAPEWVSAEIHEAAMDRFKSIVKTGMRVATVDAIDVVKRILNDDTTDNRGRPLTAASTKLQAAQFLLEHVVGKPTQRIESDVSVKLQAILGTIMVNPSDAPGGYTAGHFPGLTMELAALQDDNIIDGEVVTDEDEDWFEDE